MNYLLIFLLSFYFLGCATTDRGGMMILQTGEIYNEKSKEVMPFSKLTGNKSFLFETLEKGAVWTYGGEGAETIAHIKDKEWVNAEIINSNKILVLLANKMVGVYNIDKEKIEQKYPGVFIWSTLVEGVNMVFSIAEIPSAANNYTVDLYAHFPFDSKPTIFKKVGGSSLRYYSLRPLDKGFLNTGAINPMSNFVVNFGNFIAINSMGTDGSLYSHLISKDGVSLIKTIGLVSSIHTTTKDSMNSQFHKNLSENFITQIGNVSGSALAKKIYLPIDAKGKLIPLPEGVIGVTPIKGSGANYGIGWILLKPEGNQLVGYLHFGQFESLPPSVEGLIQAREVSVFNYGGSHHNNIAYKNDKEEWTFLPQSDKKFLEFFPVPEKLPHNDFGAILNERQQEVWKKHRLANKAYYDEQDRIRNEEYARQRAINQAEYEKVKAQGKQCSYFELAKAVSTTAIEYYLQNCWVSDYHIQEARYLGVNPNTVSVAEKKVVEQKKQKEREKAEEIARKNSSYVQSYSNSFSSSTPSSPATPYVAPSQNLNQQQRYQYEVYLNKTIFNQRY